MLPHLINSDLELPTSEQLPDSDDTAVDNENQNTIPNWLIAMLEQIWGQRQDWFFGVDMGIYDREAQKKGSPIIVPDGFLSVGVQRHKREGKGRFSYVLQEENEIVPILALELVSKTYGQEYDKKLNKYAEIGVKYYIIYNREYSYRDKHKPWEIYKLVKGQYQLQKSEPFWMPEIQLGIGRVRGEIGGIRREWLAWHDEEGNSYPLPQVLIRQLEGQVFQLEEQVIDLGEQVIDLEEQVIDLEEQLLQERQKVKQERLEKLQLIEQLRKLGIDIAFTNET